MKTITTVGAMLCLVGCANAPLPVTDSVNLSSQLVEAACEIHNHNDQIVIDYAEILYARDGQPWGLVCRYFDFSNHSEMTVQLDFRDHNAPALLIRDYLAKNGVAVSRDDML